MEILDAGWAVGSWIKLDGMPTRRSRSQQPHRPAYAAKVSVNGIEFV